MQVSTVIPTTASAALTSKTFGQFEDANASNIAVWEVVVSATGSVTLQGSLDGATWGTLPLPTGAAGAAVTATSIVTTAKAPFMRAQITANTGNITVLVAA